MGQQGAGLNLGWPQIKVHSCCSGDPQTIVTFHFGAMQVWNTAINQDAHVLQWREGENENARKKREVCGWVWHDTSLEPAADAECHLSSGESVRLRLNQQQPPVSQEGTSVSSTKAAVRSI